MTRIAEVINVFYSSTASIETFDRKLSFDKACHRVGIAKNVKLHVIYWRDNIPGGISSRNAQDVIDQSVKDSYDIYVGVLGAKHGPGTIHEYEQAVKDHVAGGRPQELFFGFDETPVNPFILDNSFFEVKNFRENIGTSVVYGRAMLYFTFSDAERFEDQVFLNLCTAVDRILVRVRGGLKIGGSKSRKR